MRIILRMPQTGMHTVLQNQKHKGEKQMPLKNK
jgi:hypothetical protein